jgi:hypothetical protein
MAFEFDLAPPDERRYPYVYLDSEEGHVDEDTVQDFCKSIAGEECDDPFDVRFELVRMFVERRFTRGSFEYVKSQVRAFVDKTPRISASVVEYVERLLLGIRPLLYKTSVLSFAVWLSCKFGLYVTGVTLSKMLCCMCFEHEYEGRAHVEAIKQFYEHHSARLDREHIKAHMLLSYDIDVAAFQFDKRIVTKPQTEMLVRAMDGSVKGFGDSQMLTPYPHIFRRDRYEHEMRLMTLVFNRVEMTREDAVKLMEPLRRSVPSAGVYEKAAAMLSDVASASA